MVVHVHQRCHHPCEAFCYGKFLILAYTLHLKQHIGASINCLASTCLPLKNKMHKQ